MGAFAKFYFRPSKGEWVNTSVEPESSDDCGIIGVVSGANGAVGQAMVLLCEAEGSAKGRLVSSMITGEDGQFAFGPLRGGQLYEIKIYKDSLKLRELEISV